ncbi:MAG: hypothetical protein IPL96_15105 [Holophagaceae bacterium]|nr:hypothetical protein [Holophagaceae bacterium]
MIDSTPKLPPELAAKIALNESVRARKLFSEIPKWPLFLIAALSAILTASVQAIWLFSWGKLVFFMTVCMLCPLVITYLYVIVNKIDTLSNYLLENKDR